MSDARQMAPMGGNYSLAQDHPMRLKNPQKPCLETAPLFNVATPRAQLK